ncbi:MAG: hypothetical protein ACRD3G_25650 [Vicinamibacterales bacterium]
MLRSNTFQRVVLHAILLAVFLFAAKPASAQYGMDFSVYTGIEWDGIDVYGWVDGYDNSWGCNHFDYSPATYLFSPTRAAYGGSYSSLSFAGDEGTWEVGGGFTFYCSCIYSYTGVGPVQFQQVLEQIPTSLSVVSDTFLNPPPAGNIYNRERHYQVMDQFAGPLHKAGLSVTEGYSTPVHNPACFAGGIPTGEDTTNSSGQFKDNYLMGGMPPVPCQSQATQTISVDGRQVGQFTVTWTHSTVSVSP